MLMNDHHEKRTGSGHHEKRTGSGQHEKRSGSDPRPLTFDPWPLTFDLTYKKDPLTTYTFMYFYECVKKLCYKIKMPKRDV